MQKGITLDVEIATKMRLRAAGSRLISSARLLTCTPSGTAGRDESDLANFPFTNTN